jgi:hypothetical protein
MSGKLINRRNFMKSSLASVAGFPLLASSGLKQEEKIEEKGGKKRKEERRESSSTEPWGRPD